MVNIMLICGQCGVEYPMTDGFHCAAPRETGRIILVDIDGTLSKVGDRSKCLFGPNPDWDSFYDRCGEDLAFEDMFEMVNLLSTKYDIVFVSGRRESCREVTMKFLRDNCNFDVMDGMVLLRENGDHRHDIILKPQMVVNAGIELNMIFAILEDRDSMVKAWRKLGVRVLQVAAGDF